MLDVLPKVVLSCRVFPETLSLFEGKCDVVANQTDDALTPQSLRQRCADAEALMAFMPDSIDASFLENCPRLRIVGCALKGFDNFDVKACTRRQVWVSIVPDLLTEPTAELAIGLTIGVSRNLPMGDRLVRNGFDGWRPVLYGTGLSGSSVGILGMGAVGQAIARRLQGFSVELFYHDTQVPDPDTEAGLAVTRLDAGALAAGSDFLIVAVPLNPSTRGMIDAEFLRGMKRGAYLINPARGSVVNEEDIADALDSGSLAGYAADVYEFEDWALADRPREIPDRLLQNRERTLFTPHIGSAVSDVRRAIERDAAQNILEALAGKTPHGAINSPAASLGAAPAD